jgi:YjbE family integral membrane protein
VGALWAEVLQPAFWVAAGQIILINIVLSGDNAVVIALACRTLPPRERFWGMILGAGVAVVLRIIFTVFVAQAMEYPYVALGGGLLLLWVAVKLVVPEEDGGEGKIAAAENLWRAVRIVAIADIVMSLDNVIAIAGAAKAAAAVVDPAYGGAIRAILIIFGLATSIPLIIAGSALLMALLDRYPILIWAGAGLLGWVAGDIMLKDAALPGWISPELLKQIHYFPIGSLPGIGPLTLNLAAVIGAAFVVGTGYLIRRMRHKEPLDHPLVVDPPGPEEFPHKQAERQPARDRA